MLPVDTATQRILNYGADLVGAGVGFAAELLGKEYVASGAGGPIAAGVSAVLKEFGARSLSRREQARVGGVACIAIERISARLLSGYAPRSDGFLEANSRAASPAEELFEAVLIKARDEYESRKLKYLGLFFGNLAFTESVAPTTAHLLLRHAQRLTYRQFVLLSLVGKESIFDAEPLRRPTHADSDLEALKREEWELHSNSFGQYALIQSEGQYSDVLSNLGNAFYELANLNEIADAETNAIKRVVADLRVLYGEDLKTMY